jgi:iron complex transport system substrate-binding protein
MTGMIMRWLLAGLASIASLGAYARPTHIMSVNLCADQLVLALAQPGDIASVSYLARKCDISVACEQAAGVAINYGTAEEMVATAPDLLIAGKYTTRATVAVARKFGKNLIELDVPKTMPEVRAQIMRVADALGALVADIDRRIAALPLPPAEGKQPVAAVYETNGFTIGPGSMIDTLLKMAGFDNLSDRRGIGDYDYLPLELLVADQPDLLIMNTEPVMRRPSLGGMLLAHPVLRAAFPASREAVVPQRLWICGGPAIVDALSLLTTLRQRIEANGHE